MRIFSNILALLASNAARFLARSAEKTLRRLTGGLRISISADDAAGLAISEKLRAQVRGLDQAVRNAQNGVSMLQTAKGALSETHSLLHRIRELSVQAANDTLTLRDRTYIQQEVDQLKAELDRIASTTQFNRKRLLSGDAAVLWSTDSLDVRVFVDGSLRSKDIFGQTKVNEGNFRLRITPTAGEAEVLKTNIFYLKHGTVSENVLFSPESGAISGLEGLRSLHLIEGEYRLESREVPYGAITYHLANGTESANPAADLGVVAMEASALPDILPYGEYQVRVADQAPFMAHYGSESGGVFGTQVIDRVDPMERNNVDLSMDASNVAGAVNSQTSLAWTDIGGAGAGTVNVVLGGGVTGPAPAGPPYPSDGTAGDVVLNVRDDYDINMWTHFNVTGTQSRTHLTNDINLNTYYRSEAGAQATLGLTYRAAAAETVTLQTTFQTAAGSSLSITRLGVTNSVNVAGMDIQQAATAIHAALGAWGWGGSATPVDAGGGQWRIDIQNTSGEDFNIVDVGRASDLGLAGVIANGGTRTGTARDFERDHVVNVGGQAIDAAAGILQAPLGAAYGITFTANPLGGGRSRLEINNSSAGVGVLGGHRLHVVADAGESPSSRSWGFRA